MGLPKMAYVIFKAIAAHICEFPRLMVASVVPRMSLTCVLMEWSRYITAKHIHQCCGVKSRQDIINQFHKVSGWNKVGLGVFVCVHRVWGDISSTSVSKNPCNINFYLRPVLAYRYCCCLCLSACVSVHPSVCQQACPRDNLSPVSARITKFRQNMQGTLVKIPIVLWIDWSWPTRSNLTKKSKFHTSHVSAPNNSFNYLDCFMIPTVSWSLSSAHSNL